MFILKSQGVFQSRLDEMIAEWNLYQTISAKITVPPEMIWWYWQEFGTAAFAEATPSYPGYFVPRSPDPTITLRFEGLDGSIILAKSIFTHGVPAKHMVTSVLNDIRRYAFTRVRDVLKATGYSAIALEDLLLTDVMAYAKTTIMQSFAMNLSEHAGRQFGRLGSTTPAEEFEANATIVNTSI